MTALIPHNDTLVSLQDSFRSVHKRIDDLTKGNINMRGHQITNLGDARSGSDAVTLRQLHKISQDAAVVREVRTIVQQDMAGPWVRVGSAVSLVNTSDQVGIGLNVFPSATPKLHVRVAAAASFPSVAPADFLLVENSGNASIGMIVGATSTARINFYGSGDAAVDAGIVYNRNAQQMTFAVATVNRVRITAAGSLLTQLAGALTTTATDGFLYVPTCAGTPTGAPTAQTGMAALVYDTTNNVLYVYAGGAWRTH